MLKVAQVAQMAGTNVNDPQDLGSSPRSGKYSMLFFNIHSYAGTLLRTTIVHPQITIHASYKSKSRAMIKGVH